MNVRAIGAPLCALALAFSAVAAAADGAPLPREVTFTTLAITPLAIEGLTGDAAGNLYTTGRAPLPDPCPVWRFDGQSGARTTAGTIPNTGAGCNPSGITFDAYGNLYVADAAQGGQVWKLARNGDGTFALGVAFATGVPGTNGLAFDRDGNLWTGDGTTNQGRVWRISPTGGACEPAFTGCQEVFHIQPMQNDKAVGRQALTFPTGNAQGLVANGLAFTDDGDLYVADTARGAIWKVRFHRDGSLKSRTGCDTTFAANTLCMENVFAAHPLLEGSDGIALDRAGNIWSDANERNAVVVVTPQGNVTEVFRNPVNAAGLRNSADTAEGNRHILETPTSPFLSGKRFCTANSDGNRRDNSPNNVGEVSNNNGSALKGKISCMDQALVIPGEPLPVR